MYWSWIWFPQPTHRDTSRFSGRATRAKTSNKLHTCPPNKLTHLIKRKEYTTPTIANTIARKKGDKVLTTIIIIIIILLLILLFSYTDGDNNDDIVTKSLTSVYASHDFNRSRKYTSCLQVSQHKTNLTIFNSNRLLFPTPNKFSYFSADPPCLPCPQSKAILGPLSQRVTAPGSLDVSSAAGLPGQGCAVRLREGVCVCVFCRCVCSSDPDKWWDVRRTAARHLHE